MPPRLVMLGPPGADTQSVSAYLAHRLAVPWISIREATQSATRAGSELGIRMRRFIDMEQLPPTELVAALVLRRLCEPDASDGFVFWTSDGPLVPFVVRALERLEVSVIELTMSDVEATRRLTGRRMCRACGKVWHVDSSPQAVVGVCEWCDGELLHREDDLPAAVARRLREYHDRNGPVLTQYRAAGRLTTVDAARAPEDVAEELYAPLAGRD